MTWVWWVSLTAISIIVLLGIESVRRLHYHGHSPAEIGRATLGILALVAFSALVIGGAVMMVSDFAGVMFRSGQRAVRNLYSPERPLIIPLGFLAAGIVTSVASYVALKVSLTKDRLKPSYLQTGLVIFGLFGGMAGIIMIYVSIHLMTVAIWRGDIN